MFARPRGPRETHPFGRSLNQELEVPEWPWRQTPRVLEDITRDVRCIYSWDNPDEPGELAQTIVGAFRRPTTGEEFHGVQINLLRSTDSMTEGRPQGSTDSSGLSSMGVDAADMQ